MSVNVNFCMNLKSCKFRNIFQFGKSSKNTTIKTYPHIDELIIINKLNFKKVDMSLVMSNIEISLFLSPDLTIHTFFCNNFETAMNLKIFSECIYKNLKDNMFVRPLFQNIIIQMIDRIKLDKKTYGVKVFYNKKIYCITVLNLCHDENIQAFQVIINQYQNIQRVNLSTCEDLGILEHTSSFHSICLDTQPEKIEETK